LIDKKWNLVVLRYSSFICNEVESFTYVWIFLFLHIYKEPVYLFCLFVHATYIFIFILPIFLLDRLFFKNNL
jgi:hypothetical protein